MQQTKETIYKMKGTKSNMKNKTERTEQVEISKRNNEFYLKHRLAVGSIEKYVPFTTLKSAISFAKKFAKNHGNIDVVVKPSAKK